MNLLQWFAMGVPFFASYLYGFLTADNVSDSVDNLNYFYTSFILIFASFAITAKQYFGSPIQCWTPVEFRGY